MLLPEPLEFIDLAPGTSMTIEVTGYQDGSAVIHPGTVTSRHISIHMQQNNLSAPPPAGTPIRNEVPVLRLIGKRVDEASNASYFDISSKTLRADLLARLMAGVTLPFTVQLTANGQRPRKRYSVEIVSN
jgi:hypothetical protein